jgi:hypothetical protein
MGPEALWFFAGAFAFQILSKLFRLGQLVRLSIETATSLLIVLSTVHEDIYFARELKYKKLEEDGVTGDDLELIKALDERATKAWRDSVIEKFKSGLPSSIAGIFKFNNWDEAMAFMQKNIKRG